MEECWLCVGSRDRQWAPAAILIAVEFLGDRVWTELEKPIGQARRRRAAIAFAGRSAAQILPLQRGDCIVIDGSDAALAAGSTHPDAIEVWLAAGAIVRSLPGLHAKVILLEHADKTRVVVVGSANASDNSRDRLIEAAIMTDDESICEAVSEQLDIWTALGTSLTQQWLTHARAIYRQPRHPQFDEPKRRRPAPDRSKPLWIGAFIPTDEPLAASAEAAHHEVMRRYGRGAEVALWFLNRNDEKTVLVGHNVVLINQAFETAEPHGSATAWPPAIVARVEPGSARTRPVAFLVRDPDLGRRRFREVRAAVHHAGGSINWDAPLDAGPLADAVHALWSPA